MIYITDSDNGRIEKFTKEGEYVNWGSDSTKTLRSPHGIAVNNTTNEIYVSEETANCIKKFDKDGILLLQWGSYFDVNNHENRLDGVIHQGDGQFNHPIGLAIDSKGNVYVADQLIIGSRNSIVVANF